MTMVYIGLGIVVFLVVAVLVGKGKIPEPPANLSDDDIRKAAQQGQKIQAIKWYRSLHGVGLKDAKDAVEKMTVQS
jgi:large subunit ribosomal protein L7/L12